MDADGVRGGGDLRRIGPGGGGFCTQLFLYNRGKIRKVALTLEVPPREKIAGVAAAGGSGGLMAAAETYAQELGLAFQIRDDMLDVCGDAAEFGKPIGSDKEEGKVTFMDLLGLEGCGRAVRAHTEAAKAAVADWDTDGFLAALAEKYVFTRQESNVVVDVEVDADKLKKMPEEAVQTLRLNISPASFSSVPAEQNDVSGLSAQQ